MNKALTAPLMKEDHAPTVGDYALMHMDCPVLLHDVTDTGRFSVNYVGNNGQGGGASMWYPADKFTVLRSPLDVIRCNIHHASRMAIVAASEAEAHQSARKVYTAALECMQSIADNP